MCRVTQVFCGSLVVILLSSYTAAMIPSWLSVVIFKCHGEDGNCAGALIDRQWIVTTASCFQNCHENSPRRFRAFLNISNRQDDTRLGSFKNGYRVSVEDVWIHPSYDSNSFSNNLALVKLQYHDLTLNIDDDFTNRSCSIPKVCIKRYSGFLYTAGSSRLRSKEHSWEINSDGNITLSHCSVGLGMNTIFHCANQPVAVCSDKMSKCVGQRKIVPATPICYHNKWLTSIMQSKLRLL